MSYFGASSSRGCFSVVLERLLPSPIFIQKIYCVLTLLYRSRVRVRVITRSKSKDQLGKVANSARCQLNGKNELFPVPVRA